MANQSWRVNVEERNISPTLIPSIGNTGATVIRSSKGGLTPIKINKGDSQTILNIFGNPSASYPDVWDVIEYSNKADLWISAPSKNGIYGGVAVTKNGSIPLTSGFTSLSNIDFSVLPVNESIGTGDGSTTTFLFTLTDKTYYNNTSIDITLNGTTINVSATDAATEVLTTSPNVGSGTYVRSTGVLSFTFTSPPAIGDIVKVTYTTNRASDIYFILFSKNPQADDLAVKISMSSSVFTINAYLKSGVNYLDLPDSPYSVSLTQGTKDGFQQNIYINDVFLDDNYFSPVINSSLTLSTFVDDASNVSLAGGSRGDAITITELTTGWNYFKSSNTYPADIFFDCTSDSGIPALFETLRGTYQKYSAYLLPLPNSNYATAKVTKQGYSLNNRGIYIYFNWAKVQDTYNDSYLYSALMGRVAGKHADMVDVYNGLAPAWIDENNHGGQLGSGIISMVNDLSESELQDADNNQINAITFSPQYGVMIMSHRTSATVLSDYSWIAHSRVADYIISNVVNQALPFQITKLNDINHRNLVKSKAESIINPLLAPPNALLREAVVKCDAENNNDAILAQRKFVLGVAVKFTPTSEYIKFIFVNVNQQTSVNEVI